jgi:hypothetical protein
MLAAFFAGIETPIGRMRQLERGIRVAREHADLEMSAFLSGLLGEMRAYRDLCEGLLLEKYASCTREESTWLILYFNDLVNETATEVDMHTDLYTDFYAWCMQEQYLAPVDEVLLLSLLVTAYCKDEHAWRARHYADRLQPLLKESYGERELYFVAMGHRALTCFFREVHDVRGCFAAGVACAETELLLGRAEDSAETLRDAYALVHHLPDLASQIKTDAELEAQYKEHAKAVLRYRTPHGLLIDPVEHTEAFLTCFDAVMEWVEERRTHRGFGACHELWSLMTDGFARHGIHWRSPAVMNPRVRFD